MIIRRNIVRQLRKKEEKPEKPILASKVKIPKILLAQDSIDYIERVNLKEQLDQDTQNLIKVSTVTSDIKLRSSSEQQQSGNNTPGNTLNMRSQLNNTDILSDQILIDTSFRIQRNIVPETSQPIKTQNSQDQDRILMREILESCRVGKNQFSNSAIHQLNQTKRSKHKFSIQESLAKFSDPLQQIQAAANRQQSVLEKFYVCSQRFSGIQMSSKLQKLLKRMPSIPNQMSRTKREGKALSLFAELTDEKQHERLLEQALLRDFFLEDQRDQNKSLLAQDGSLKSRREQQHFYRSKQELENWLALHESNQVRMGIRGIDEMRGRVNNRNTSGNAEETKKKQNQERMVRIANITRRTNTYKINIVKQFISNDINLKRKENIKAIDYLMDFNPKVVPSEIQEHIYKTNSHKEEMIHQDSNFKQKHRGSLLKKQDIRNLSGDEIQSILRKAFFKFSNKEESDFNIIYREMEKQKLQDFTKFMGVAPQYVSFVAIDQIFDKITKNKYNKVLSYHDFVEVIRKISYIYCTSTSPTKYVSLRRHDITNEEISHVTLKSNPSSNVNTNASIEAYDNQKDPKPIDFNQALEQFVSEVVIGFESTIIDTLDLDLRRCKCFNDFFQKFESAFKELFDFSFNLLGISTTQLSQQYLKFDEIFALLWKIGLFPNLIAKSTVRYFYYYVLTNDEGLDYEAFCRFMNIIGLSIVRNLPNKQQQTKDKKYQLLNYLVAYFSNQGKMNKQSLGVLNELGIFYIDSELLDTLNLSNRLNKILEELRDKGA